MTERIRRMLTALATINAAKRSRCRGGFLGDANMCRGWKGVALVAACWCLNLPAQAQTGTYPSPVGAARMPEPIPAVPNPNPQPPPNLVPGPISPLAAPMGPTDDLSLPYDHTGAFQTENFVQENGFYFNIGPIALQRNHLGAGDIAVYNATVMGQTTPQLPDPFTQTPTGTGSALSFNSVKPALSLGIIGTAGYLWHNQAVEFSSYYIWEDDAKATASMPFSLDTLFYNPPLTMVGDGLFRMANTVSLTQGSSLFNAEANYRRWNPAFAGLEFIIGARYIRQNDILNIQTTGYSFFENSLGLKTPGVDSTTYSVITHNNLVAPQLGLEYTLKLFSWLHLSAMGKGAWGVNYLTSDVNMTRGDGYTAFNTLRHATVFGELYNIGVFANINILERLRLRIGYTATWLIGVATANDQVDFDLKGYEARQQFGFQGVANAVTSGNLQLLQQVQNGIPHGNVNNNGSIIYFGPQAQLEFFF